MLVFGAAGRQLVRCHTIGLERLQRPEPADLARSAYNLWVTGPEVTIPCGIWRLNLHWSSQLIFLARIAWTELPMSSGPP